MLRTIKSKLLAGFVAVAVLAAIMGALGIWSSGKMSALAGELAGNYLPSLRGLARMRQGFMEVRFATTKAMLASSLGQHDQVAGFWEGRNSGFAKAREGAKLYGSLPMSNAEKVLWAKAEPGLSEFETENAKIWERLRAHDLHQAEDIQNAISARTKTTLSDPLDELIAFQEKLGNEANDLARSTASSSGRLLWIGMILCVGGAVALALLLSRAVLQSIAFLVAEAGRLRGAVLAGRLQERGDASKVPGEFQPVVGGVNEIIDAFVKPIDVTAEYVDRISKGAIPEKITETYEGDFNLIKENLNRCIDVVNTLVADTAALTRASVEGKLSTRADATKHQGDYRKIVQGVNETLDAVLNPINEAAQVLEKLAQRDLKARVKGSYQGDHAKIKEALNATAESLHESMAQVAQAVEQVSSASGQIAASSEAVAAGASEQASSLEETSASLESMSSMTKQAAENAQQANSIAQGATTAATEGSAAMEQMTGAMGKIKASAEGTSQIIKDINEIAFQTNLLALNAAVEAARAGEAGRGFAVVAEEVRSLALRSKEAANKTEELIRQSVKEAGEGEVTARHVNEKLSDIAASVTKVTGIIAELSATAREQTTGIEQVTSAVVQMNQVTQQNAASSEESSSAAAELSGQSEELAAMVGTFQLERRHEPVVAPAPRVAKAVPASNRASHRDGKKNGSIAPVTPASILPLDAGAGLEGF